MGKLRVIFIVLFFMCSDYGGRTIVVPQSEAKGTQHAEISSSLSQDTVLIAEELFRCLNLTKEEFFSKYGIEYTIRRAGAEGLCTGYYYNKYGIMVVFDSTDKVDWIECYEKVSIYGARAGMSFAEIKGILGDASVREGFLEGYFKIFLLEYTFDNNKITFDSDKPDGRNSRLIIRTLRASNLSTPIFEAR